MYNSQMTIRRIKEVLPYINLAVDSARRQFLIAPLIIDLVTATKAETNFDYPITATDKSSVTIHYFLESYQTAIIMSAKNQDLNYGIKELHLALLTVDKWLDHDSQNKIWGATTTGFIWQFSCLNRKTKAIYHDTKKYNLFKDIQDIINIFYKSLKSPIKQSSTAE